MQAVFLSRVGSKRLFSLDLHDVANCNAQILVSMDLQRLPVLAAMFRYILFVLTDARGFLGAINHRHCWWPCGDGRSFVMYTWLGANFVWLDRRASLVAIIGRP